MWSRASSFPAEVQQEFQPVPALHAQLQHNLQLPFKSFKAENWTGVRRNGCTSSSSAAAAPGGAAPRRTSSAAPAALPQLDVPADRNGRGPIPSWCRRWWRSPASATRWTLCLRSPRTLGFESRKACTVYSAPVWGPWWSGDEDSGSLKRHVSLRTLECVEDSHLISIKGAVVVHDVHCAAVEKISEASHFVWCYGVHRVYKTDHQHPHFKHSATNRADF